MSYSYNTEATVDEIASGALDQLAEAYLAGLHDSENGAATRAAMASANRALGEIAAGLPRGTLCSVGVSGHANPTRGPSDGTSAGETVTLSLSVLEAHPDEDGEGEGDTTGDDPDEDEGPFAGNNPYLGPNRDADPR